MAFSDNPFQQTTNYAGQVNQAGDSRALFLEQFAGEVMVEWHKRTMALQNTTKRTITNGNSASFPLIGRGSAGYHTPGSLIEANRQSHVKRIVNVDDVAFSAIFIASVDEAMNHFDVRQPYSLEGGRQLAEMVDRNIFRMIAKAGQIGDAAGMTAAGLTAVTGQTYTTAETIGAAAPDSLDPLAIVDAIMGAKAKFLKADVGVEDLLCVLPVDQYEALVNPSAGLNNLVYMNRDIGGVGNIGSGEIAMISGVPVVWTNNMPQTDESAGTVDPEPLGDTAVGSGNNAKYRGDYSSVKGLVFNKQAVATTELKGIETSFVEEKLRLGNTILSTQALGHDILRPECAITLLSA